MNGIIQGRTRRAEFITMPRITVSEKQSLMAANEREDDHFLDFPRGRRSCGGHLGNAHVGCGVPDSFDSRAIIEAGFNVWLQPTCHSCCQQERRAKSLQFAIGDLSRDDLLEDGMRRAVCVEPGDLFSRKSSAIFSRFTIFDNAPAHRRVLGHQGPRNLPP